MGRKAVHLIPVRDMVGRLPNFTVKKNRILGFWVVVIAVGLVFTPTAFTQESIIVNSISTVPPSEKVHALELTRFHFITLKQFHSGLFSAGEDKNSISESQAQILNAALNSFLTSPEREALLLGALREDKAIRLRFAVPEQGEDYEMISNPDKPLLFQLKPVIREVPATVEIRPVLDQPIAFKITLKKGNERHLYQVDWAGNITNAS